MLLWMEFLFHVWILRYIEVQFFCGGRAVDFISYDLAKSSWFCLLSVDSTKDFLCTGSYCLWIKTVLLFLSHYGYLSFSYFIALNKTSSKKLNSSSEIRHPNFVPNLKTRKTFLLFFLSFFSACFKIFLCVIDLWAIWLWDSV